MKKMILTAAVTGNITTLARHPGLPCTPEQIASAAIECGDANRGAIAPDNASLVRKAVHLVEELGGTIAGPAGARAILGLSAS